MSVYQVSFLSNELGEVVSQNFNTQDQETEYSVDLPKIPFNFEHLLTGYKYEPKIEYEQLCDCGKLLVPAQNAHISLIPLLEHFSKCWKTGFSIQILLIFHLKEILK
ncbi:Hypothetical_protein [Hexamita inflata]|uniref:Hypothetical_protein n=1 Tax=Hexamita inflata TaxID=28002 RepID=A0AA86PH54_9EUKA|nr:Hypothetical protein HINF_LOCUS26556 [Hexamita inflata]